MGLKDSALAGLHGALVAKARIAPPRGRLLAIMLHSVSPDLGSALNGPLDPFQPMTVDDLETLIRGVRAIGYRFATTDEVRAGGPDDALALLTFDDGYANNLRALSVLERENVPAVIFATTGAVAQGRGFWWDALFRQMTAAGRSPAETAAEADTLKMRTWQEIEAAVAERCGAKWFEPVGDEDRPMTIGELQGLARHPLIEIGNHTHDHAILTRQAADEAERQLRLAQENLTAWLGGIPRTAAYPNGNTSDAVIEAATGMGINLAVTVTPGLEALPLNVGGQRSMGIHRFMPVSTRPIAAQVARFAIGAARADDGSDPLTGGA